VRQGQARNHIFQRIRGKGENLFIYMVYDFYCWAVKMFGL